MGADLEHKTCDDVDCTTCLARERATGKRAMTPALARTVAKIKRLVEKRRSLA